MPPIGVIVPSHFISVIANINRLPENNNIPIIKNIPHILNSLVPSNCPKRAINKIANA